MVKIENIITKLNSMRVSINSQSTISPVKSDSMDSIISDDLTVTCNPIGEMSTNINTINKVHSVVDSVVDYAALNATMDEIQLNSHKKYRKTRSVDYSQYSQSSIKIYKTTICLPSSDQSLIDAGYYSKYLYIDHNIIINYIVDYIKMQSAEFITDIRNPLSLFTMDHIPSISLTNYIKRLYQYFSYSCPNILISAFIMFKRFCTYIPNYDYSISAQNQHTVFFSCYMLINKYLNDEYYSDNTSAKIGGITLFKLQQRNILFANVVKWNFFISEDEFIQTAMTIYNLTAEKK